MTKRATQATLCFLVEKDKVLLAMKKRGHGKRKWNGTGGKFDKKIDKNLLATAKRETKEEIGVRPLYLKKVALLCFRNSTKPDWNQDVHVYLTNKWKGKLAETEEMKPKWFSMSNLPFENMWADDPFWLPRVLLGEKIEARFDFDGQGEIVNFKIGRV